VTQLIARRIREAHVFCRSIRTTVSDAFVREFAPRLISFRQPRLDLRGSTSCARAAVFELGVPVLGTCYGMFTMAVQLGGQVEASTHREFGYAEVRARRHTSCSTACRLLDRRRPRHAQVWMSHGDKVTELPPRLLG